MNPYDFISIRGTNGAGKSTLVRKLMSGCQNIVPHYIEGRKKPAYYTMSYLILKGDHTFELKLAVLGHYEGVGSGGCDNLSTTDQYYDLAHEALKKADTVIAEGMICSKEFSRIQKMKYPAILFLDIPLEDCFKGVQERRVKAAKSVGRNEEKLKNTIEMNWKGVESSCRRLLEVDKPIDFIRVTERSKAWPELQKLLEGKPF